MCFLWEHFDDVKMCVLYKQTLADSSCMPHTSCAQTSSKTSLWRDSYVLFYLTLDYTKVVVGSFSYLNQFITFRQVKVSGFQTKLFLNHVSIPVIRNFARTRFVETAFKSKEVNLMFSVCGRATSNKCSQNKKYYLCVNSFTELRQWSSCFLCVARSLK